MAEECYAVPDSPVYNAENIRKIRNTDPVNAESIVNPVIEQIIENTHAVKRQADAADQELACMGEALAGKAKLDRETGKLLAAQLPGHTHHTQELLLSDGTAQALGLRSIVLKNLVVNGSFEKGDGGWVIDAGVSVGPMPDYGPAGQHGTKVLGGWPFGAADQRLGAALNSGHVYYFRMLACTDGGFSSAEVRASAGYMDNPGNSWDMLFYEGGMDLSGSPMTVVSAICSNLSGDTLRIALSDNNPNYIDAVLFIDLTEAFGAGREPDQAWCDENIPYFEGSYVLKDPTVDDALAAAELALKQLGSDLAAGVHIAAGSYTGTGTYGASDPNILTFDFEPEVVFVFQKDYSPVQTFVNDSWSGSTYVDTVFSFDLIYFFRGGASTRVGALKTKDLNGNLGQGNTQMPYTMEGNTLSWKYTDPNYGSGNIAPRAQFNESGTVYHYIAIGRGNAA